jgi:hypothetical protein
MIEDKFKVSGKLFKKILTHMDSLSRTQLMELQAESREQRRVIARLLFIM